MRVSIVGAGFSGLSLAYYLRQRGLEVDVFERQSKPGGLLQTRKDPLGLIEPAANGFWNTVRVEKFFSELQIPLAKRSRYRKNRFIFRGRPRKWPVSYGIGAKLAWKYLFKRSEFSPQVDETIAQWATRLGNTEFLDYMIAPALQGIYSGDVQQLSAELVFGKMFSGQKREKPKNRGTIAPEQGMGQMIQMLVDRLKTMGVKVTYSAEFQIAPSRGPLVLATNVWDAADYLKDRDKKLSEQLMKAESLPLVSVNAFFDQVAPLHGFGCLFPRSENFNALGVLFNNDIFEGRSQKQSETWILGGALNKSVAEISDDQILAKILEDRARLVKSSDQPIGFFIQRWPKALPHYTVEWKKILSTINPKPGIFLTGNYLGGIGLSKILDYNFELAEKIAKVRHG